jgi:hypothetical protein
VRLLQSPVELIFRDALSDRAARISVITWKIWVCLVTAVVLVPGFAALRERRPAVV